MTNDEIERIMNFIIERQERVTEQQAVTVEQLAQSEVIINALAKRQLETDEQIDDHDERIARFERSYTVISNLSQKHDSQIDAVTEGLNNLITTVNRYITTRGNGDSEA